MKIFFSPDHALHAPQKELHRGDLVPPHEGPHRIDLLVDGLKAAGMGDFSTPEDHDLAVLSTIHSAAYLEFLETAWQRWQDAGYHGDVIAITYPRGDRRSEPPKDVMAAAGYFCTSSDTSITKTSWQAAVAGVNCALSAADSVAGGERAAFALSRPPGHHAGADYMCGYCLLNTAAVAAQHLQNKGARKVAILDVDFHHGNGTQDIFYDRSDVLYASIHGEPDHHFPYFWGYADETGRGEGEGCNFNYPLPAGSNFKVWSGALASAVTAIGSFGADALVVSLGVDTFEKDPISSFKLTTEDFHTYGQTLAQLGLPTVFIMEGGYGVPEVGANAAAVLKGFLGG